MIFSQVSNAEAYKKKVYQTMASGSSNVFTCSEPETKDLRARNERAKSLAISCATAFQGGYGTNCWDDTNTEPDPACAIPAVPSSDCNGGKYRIPIAITIFECFDWAGTNYIETENGGFEPILNLDLSNKLLEVNELYANSNIEFYEINRQRVQDCDLYDFYQSNEPSTGFNDGNDDLVESVSYDIPNVINIYFVGGLFGDHDCCGLMAFAPYPPGRDYMVLRYGTSVEGSNLAHELGHYFGLPHTYAQSIDFPVIDGDGVPTGSLDNCDCLTEGDRICDTWPDPSFSHNCNHLGDGPACYMAGGSSCAFDEAAYAAHIVESHGDFPPNLLISPNSGTTFSTTSSTVLSQNIMSNNFIFGCTTTFSPCQYKKIHDVARSDCRNYLCNTNASDYFQNTAINTPNTSNYEICIGDEIPTFQAGNTISRLDGSQYELDCFDWYMGEFDEQSEAILVNSSSFTPTAGQININEAGTYEFWVAEVNSLNDPPCKVKVTVTVADNPGTAITTTNEGTIDACTESNLTVDASGTSINNTVDIIGWYFSDANPTEIFTTGVAAQTAIQSATNSYNWNATTGNIVQSDANIPLSSLSNVSIDCNTLNGDDGTYFLTPFIAKGAIAQNCSTSSTSSSFNWNIAGGFTGGATVNLGPIHDCSVAGLSVDDFSVTLSINDCETVGGDIGAKIYFNRGTELSINTPFDFTFDCTQDEIIISGNDLRRLKANYDPMVDQLQINFINTNFFRTNFQGTIDLNLNARIDVDYSGDNAQVIWNANNRPNIDTSNMDCFWGDPITVLCDCENSICPEIGDLTGSTSICSGDINATLAVDGIQNIGNFNMEFVYFTERQTDSSLYVNIPNGILGNGLMVEQVPYPAEAGTYYVYARLNPAPINVACRPFQELIVEVVDLPSSPITEDIFYCEGDSIISSVEGTNLLWYDTPIGGDGRENPMFNLAVLDTQSYWVSQTINACESARSKLDIIRVNRPNPPNIPDVNLCMGDESSELVEGIPNLKWYTTETSEIGTSEAPVINSAIAGTTTYWVSRSSICESERVPVVVTVNAFPINPIVQDVFYCLGATAEPLSAGGGNLRWYDSFSDLVGTDIAPTPRTDSIGVFSYMVSQTINGCESSRAIIKVTISTVAPPPIVNDVSVCQGTPITLEVQGTNLKWFDSSTDSTSSDTIPIPMTNVIGTQSFWVSQIIGGCESERVEIQATINEAPQSPITSNIHYCVNSEAVALTAIGDSLVWYTSAVGGNGLDRIVPATDTAGTQNYWVSQMVNGCESERSLINVIVGNDVEIEIASIEHPSVCSGMDGNISIANLMANTTYQLSYVVNNEIFTDSLNSDTLGRIIITGLSAGQYENIFVTDGCSSNQLKARLTDPSEEIFATLNSNVTQLCDGSTTHLFATITGGRTPYTLVYNNGIRDSIILDYTSGDLIEIRPIQTDSFRLIRIVDANNCTGTVSRENVIITVLDNPTTPITVPINYCKDDMTSALSASGDSLIWYTSAIGGTGMASIIPSTDSVGIQEFWVSQMVNGCESDRAMLQVTIDPIPSTPIVSNINYFLNETADPLTAIGNQLLWYTDNSEVGVTTAPIPTTDMIGTQTYSVSQTINNCESEQISITVTIQEKEVTEEDTELILPTDGDNGSIKISGLMPDTIYVLSYTKDSIEIVDTLSTDQDGIVVIDDLESGNYNITINFNGETVSVLEIDLPDANCNLMAVLNAIDTICQGEEVRLNIAISNGKGPYQLTLSDGIQNHEFSDYVNGTNLSFTIDSTTTYTLIQLVDIDSCAITGVVNPITITVNTTNAPMVAPVTYCAGFEASPLTAEGIDLKWYTSAIGGTSIDTIVPLTDNMGVQQFWVSQTINGCESPRSLLEVVIEEQTARPIVTSTNVCVGEEIALVAEGVNLRWYETATGGEGFDILIPSADSAGVQQFWVSQTVNGCESDRVLMNVMVNALPSPPITKDFITCTGTSILLTAEGENLQWYNSEAGGNAVDSIMSDPTIIGVQTYWVSQTLNACESTRSSINVSVRNQPTPPITTNRNTCEGTSILLTAEGENLLWYNSATEGSGVDSIYSDPDIVGIQTYWVSQTIDNCESLRAMMLVSNSPKPSAPEVLNATYFLNETATPIMASGNQLRWYTTAISNDGTSTAPIPNTSIPGIQTYWISQTINDCESDRILVTITVIEEVSIGLGVIVSPTDITNGSIQLTGLLADTTYTLIYVVNGDTITTTATTDAAGNYVITDLVAGNYSDIRVVLDGQSSSSLAVTLTQEICNLLVAFSENDTICPGEASSFSIVIENGSNPYNLVLSDGFDVFDLPSYVSGTSIPVMPTTTSVYGIVSLEDSNGCRLIGDDNMGQVIISVQETVAPITTDVIYCKGSTELTPLSAIGNNLLWYTAAIGGEGSSTPPVPNTNTAGITTYWVSQEVNNCESPRAMISVDVKEEIVPPSVAASTYCLGTNATPLKVEGDNLLWYTSRSGGVGTSIQPTINTDEVGTTTYWVSQTIDGCESTRAITEVTIDDTKPNPPIVESVNYCRGDETLPFNVQGENLRWYVLPIGGVGTIETPHPTANLTGIYYYWVSQSINGCESDRARISITINETPVPEIGLVIPPSPCLKNGAIQLKNLLPNRNYQLSYTVDNQPKIPYTITTTNRGTHIFTGLAAGSYSDIKVQLGNCSSVGLQQELEDLGELVSVDFIGDTTICKGEAATMFLNIEGGVAPYNLVISDINQTYSLSNYESGEGITIDPTETTSYFLISVTDNNGCATSFGNQIVRITVSDCTSTGSFQDGTLENTTNLFSLNNQRLKKSKDFELFQNKPNPFSSQTTIDFYLPANSEVELILRDNTGRIIKRSKEFGTKGINHITIDDLGGIQGLIYYQLITEFGAQSKKMLLVR